VPRTSTVPKAQRAASGAVAVRKGSGGAPGAAMNWKLLWQ
jgi:hypothetical protein